MNQLNSDIPAGLAGKAFQGTQSLPAVASHCFNLIDK